MKSLLAGASLAAAGASVASAGFTGYTVDRVVTAAGNIQYKVYGNWDTANLVFLNAFNFATQSGSMNARHQDAAEDLDGNPSQSWSASVNLLGTAARDNDSWVTASGSGTSAGNDASLDPGFNPSNGNSIPNGAGWFDATPGTANVIAAGGASGYRMLLMQIVRNGNDADLFATFYVKNSFKLAGTTTALFGEGTFTIGSVPAPGALALLGLAGMAGRRRR
jgi:MYXO-CTERM domain-containing protein